MSSSISLAILVWLATEKTGTFWIVFAVSLNTLHASEGGLVELEGCTFAELLAALAFLFFFGVDFWEEESVFIAKFSMKKKVSASSWARLPQTALNLQDLLKKAYQAEVKLRIADRAYRMIDAATADFENFQ